MKQKITIELFMNPDSKVSDSREVDKDEKWLVNLHMAMAAKKPVTEKIYLNCIKDTAFICLT